MVILKTTKTMKVMETMNVQWANVAEIEKIVPLFDAYRQFYELPSDVGLSRALLTARMNHQQSKVVLATDEAGAALGFIQLYPMFSSLSLSLEGSSVWLLNDLFVSPQARGQGVGAALLEFVQAWSTAEKLGYLMLETAKTNTTAQRLYESQGWQRDEVYYTYYHTPSFGVGDELTD